MPRDCHVLPASLRKFSIRTKEIVMTERATRKFWLLVMALASVSPLVAHARTKKTDNKKGKDIYLTPVVVTGKAGGSPGSGLSLSDVFTSTHSEKVISSKDFKHLGPVAGSAQALSIAPGVNVAGYGNTGSTKNSISINGVKQGWGGAAGGGIDDGSISVTFDGIPMIDPATGLWQSSEVPQLFMIKGIKLTYGPGSAVDKWYNNIGGQISFVPVQPSQKAGAAVQLGFGSYQARNLAFTLQSGNHNGWEMVLSGGLGESNNYRNSIGGFENPSSNYAWFFKTRKTFNGGDLSFGIYDAQGRGYRPNYIPVNPIQGVTIYGYDKNGNVITGPLYSQQTTGFYSALPYNVWRKKDYNRTLMYYIKLNTKIAPDMVFHNRTWYRRASRLHNHYYNYVQNANNLYEHNNPYNYMYGDKAWLEMAEPYNTIAVGGWFLHDVYNTRNAFYNPNPPYNGTVNVPNAHYRSDYFEPTYLAAFLQDRIYPTENLEITPGVRWINYAINYYPGAAQDFPKAYAQFPQNNQGQLPPASTQFHEMEPSLSFNWKASQHVSIHGSYGISYREPNNGGGGGPFQSVPAYSLRLEKGTDYQGGVRLFWRQAAFLKNFLFSANYYHLKYTGQYIPITSQNGTYLATAQGNSHYEGINLYAEDDPVKNFHVFTNISFETAKFDQYKVGSLSYNGRWVSQVPAHTFNVGASYTIRSGAVSFEPRAWYQEVGPQHIFNNNIGAPSGQTMSAYGLVNIGLNVDVPFASSAIKDLKFNLSVLNAFNKQYNVYEYVSSGGYFVSPNSQGATLAYPGAPRTIYLSAEAYF